ncbi:MAG: DUF58 domain-containing protein [Rhodobacterales bacterium]|nr:DUF58 domain-containing protein [Rhodobacterales bacterium]
MIPSRALVICSLLPLGVAVLAVTIPAAVVPMVALDVVLIGVALIDALRARGEVSVTRMYNEVQAVGRPFQVELLVKNEGDQLLFLRVSDDGPGESDGLPCILELPGKCVSPVSYQRRVDSRGQHPFGVVTVRCRSPWGLWERQKTLEMAGDLRVYPDFAQLRQGGIDAKLAQQQVPVRARRRPGGESEFERLRPYVPGDSYRHIDWKATARKREFVTRSFRQESNQNLIFLLDTGRNMSVQNGAITAFDHALNAVVMLGQTALRHGDRVGVLAFDRKIRAWLPPKGGARSGGRLIRGTYDLFPSMEEPDYAMAFRYLGQRVRRRSLIVVLTSVSDEVSGERASSMSGALTSRHLAMNIWLRDPAVDELMTAPSTTRLDVFNRCAAAEMLTWREKSLSQLRRKGVLVVDCQPASLSTSLLSRYLEIKARRLL